MFLNAQFRAAFVDQLILDSAYAAVPVQLLRSMDLSQEGISDLSTYRLTIGIHICSRLKERLKSQEQKSNPNQTVIRVEQFSTCCFL